MVSVFSVAHDREEKRGNVDLMISVIGMPVRPTLDIMASPMAPYLSKAKSLPLSKTMLSVMGSLLSGPSRLELIATILH